MHASQRCTPVWDCLAAGAGPFSLRSGQPRSSRDPCRFDDALGSFFGRGRPKQPKPKSRVCSSVRSVQHLHGKRYDTMPKAPSGHESWIMLGFPLFYQSDLTDGWHPTVGGLDCLRHPVTISLSLLLPPLSSQALPPSTPSGMRISLDSLV